MNTLRSPILLAGLVVVCSSSAQTTITATAVAAFDPVGAGTISAYAGTLTAADVTAFQTRLNTAFADGLGGVWNGSSTSPIQADGAGGDVTFDRADIAVGAGLSFRFAESGNIGGLRTAAFSSATATSGSRMVGFDDTTAATWTLSLLGPSSSGLRITQLGLVLLGRSGSPGIVTLTASFSGGGTQALSVSSAVIQPTNAFFLFQAPAGEAITQLAYSSTLGRINPIDDLAVIAVPEPSAYAVFAAGAALGLALWRRRR